LEKTSLPKASKSSKEMPEMSAHRDRNMPTNSPDQPDQPKHTDSANKPTTPVAPRKHVVKWGIPPLPRDGDPLSSTSEVDDAQLEALLSYRPQIDLQAQRAKWIRHAMSREEPIGIKAALLECMSPWAAKRLADRGNLTASNSEGELAVPSRDMVEPPMIGDLNDAIRYTPREGFFVEQSPGGKDQHLGGEPGVTPQPPSVAVTPKDLHVPERYRKLTAELHTLRKENRKLVLANEGHENCRKLHEAESKAWIAERHALQAEIEQLKALHRLEDSLRYCILAIAGRDPEEVEGILQIVDGYVAEERLRQEGKMETSA
jgi:hypothetical protein